MKKILISIFVCLMIAQSALAIVNSNTPPRGSRITNITFSSANTMYPLYCNDGMVLAFDFTANGGVIRKHHGSALTSPFRSIKDEQCYWNQQRVYYDKGSVFWFSAPLSGVTLEAEVWYY